LDKIIEELSAGGVLPEKCHVHKLKGDLQDCFECHVLPDWLLVYRKYEDILILELIATGSHASLFS
jgi:mRNA interferase YafQ